MNSAIIEVSSLCYDYPGRRALDDVGFTLTNGTITALVGPNGAGKTTLLRCLAGMDRPLSGRINICGIDVVDEPRRSHRVLGYLSDFFGLYETLTVRQSLRYVARANLLAVSETESTVEHTAAELGLADRLDQPCSTLSRGLRQRVAIAQAVIHQPRVVLLDEPASGLDPEARYQLGELFLSLRQRGMTLLVSSHILAELESYSSHMLILNDGKIVDHRALAATGQTWRDVEIHSAGPSESIIAALKDEEQVTAIKQDAARVIVTLADTDTVRAQILKQLVDAGIPVTYFAPIEEDIQQTYLHSMSGRGSES